jgi:hypothetical protein
MGEALELIEDMISVDLFQARTKDRFRGHPKILCCYTQEVFFSGRYYLFKFFCRLLNVPVVPVKYQHRVYQLQVQQKDQSSYNFRAFKSRLSLKR